MTKSISFTFGLLLGWFLRGQDWSSVPGSPSSGAHDVGSLSIDGRQVSRVTQAAVRQQRGDL